MTLSHNIDLPKIHLNIITFRFILINRKLGTINLNLYTDLWEVLIQLINLLFFKRIKKKSIDVNWLLLDTDVDLFLAVPKCTKSSGVPMLPLTTDWVLLFVYLFLFWKSESAISTDEDVYDIVTGYYYSCYAMSWCGFVLYLNLWLVFISTVCPTLNVF